jgi:uncharacterized membrane protein
MMDRMADERPDVSRPFLLERIVFFSDAVFAIAITLLALDLRLPETAAALKGGALDTALAALGPRLVAYAFSFGVIGLYWLAHWRRYSAIRAANEGLAIINLILLGLVAVIPFPTSLLAEHGDQPTVVVIYALVVAAAGVAGSASWLYAARTGLTVSGSERWVRLVALRGLAVPFVFVVTLPLAFINPLATQAAWLLGFPLQALVTRRLRRLEGTEEGPRRAAAERGERATRPDVAPS